MNTIAKRISDFLKDFPPFNMLSKDQLLAICSAVEILHLEKDADLFISGEPIKNQFYLVKDGAIFKVELFYRLHFD